MRTLKEILKGTVLAPLGAGIALSVFLSACFTGVESTPKIEESELKRAKAAKPTSEELFLQGVVPPVASEWRPGKALIVADPKIRIVLSNGAGDELAELNAGEVLSFRGFESATSLLGGEATDVVFSTKKYPDLRYRLAVPPEALSGKDAPAVDVPFTVDPSLAHRADSLVMARTGQLYILSPLWYDAATEKAVSGYRLVEVLADSVRPGNHIFPLKLYFRVADPDLAATPVGSGEKMVYLADGGRTSGTTRTFASLFSFTDRRKRYPEISDEVWTLIINSRVREGMTKEECRLALGSPASVELSPTRVGDLERWGYSDGVYLIFSPEGTLMRFQL